MGSDKRGRALFIYAVGPGTARMFNWILLIIKHIIKLKIFAKLMV